ncbi:glycosyltransferase [Pseudoxanthomonas sp. PXM03]|uniref:glycosyltransferase family 2 protein n=1 Tax=Pseudoxanthomonas sp. PXM03 TaxID=2769284 RepID=UPI00177ECFA9|nr:glycosyltransferase [Pseudoxanthomonas sp. PXM03]MBD9436412.1 glycosyltransferase [Pseudoxanthomonas sp. PXM03]
MAPDIEVSVIIPTYNRRDLLPRAIDSVLAQTRRVDEIIVVDDGSTDGTADMLEARYGERVKHVWQSNAGVSAARNHGLRLARGRYLALLDSDDEWLPEKTALQVAFLESRPDFGMVVCDVERIDGDYRHIDVFHRREVIREDGWALRWLLHNPALIPASVMVRRQVVDQLGGFDEALRTAEDLEFHLRVARHWPIGVVERALVRAMRGHDGLSAASSTYDDYVRVVEAAVAGARGTLDDGELDAALAGTYLRNARGMLIRRRWVAGARLASRAWRLSRDRGQRREILALLPFGLKRFLRGLLPAG